MIPFLRWPGGPIGIGTTTRPAGRLKPLTAGHGEGPEAPAVVAGSSAEGGLRDTGAAMPPSR